MKKEKIEARELEEIIKLIMNNFCVDRPFSPDELYSIRVQLQSQAKFALFIRCDISDPHDPHDPRGNIGTVMYQFGDYEYVNHLARIDAIKNLRGGLRNYKKNLLKDVRKQITQLNKDIFKYRAEKPPKRGKCSCCKVHYSREEILDLLTNTEVNTFINSSIGVIPVQIPVQMPLLDDTRENLAIVIEGPTTLLPQMQSKLAELENRRDALIKDLK